MTEKPGPATSVAAHVAGRDGSIAAIILAAGQARRFGVDADTSKVIAKLNGEPLVRVIAKRVLATRASPVIVVTGHAFAAVEAAVTDLPLKVARNARHASGQASSLQAGLSALPAAASGAVVLLADMPLVRSRTIDSLIDRFEMDRDVLEAVIPTFEGRLGNPVLVGRRLFGELARLDGDTGARPLLSAADRMVALCPVDDPGIEIDVDNRDALQTLNELASR